MTTSLPLASVASPSKCFPPLNCHFPGFLSYNFAALTVLFFSCSNTCSDCYVGSLLTSVFHNLVWSTCTQELHILLNIGMV